MAHVTTTPEAPSAEWAFFHVTPKRARARRMAVALALTFYLGGMAITFGVSMAHHRGTGFGDGHLVASCATPGGPYYPPDLPAAQRTCTADSVGRVKAESSPPVRDLLDVGRILASITACGMVLFCWIRLLDSIGVA